MDIEKAVREAVEQGRLVGVETLKAQATVKVADVALNIQIDGEIKLS